MEFKGKVWRDGSMWLIEVPSLNLMTQGRSKKDAFVMIRDAALGLIECYLESDMPKGFDVTVIDHRRGSFSISSNDDKSLLVLASKLL